MTTKKAPKGKRAKPAAADRQPFSAKLKRSAVFAAKLAFLLLLLLTFYLIYLDSKISKKFSGQKWQVPAQIYARSLELVPGKVLTQP